MKLNRKQLRQMILESLADNTILANLSKASQKEFGGMSHKDAKSAIEKNKDMTIYYCDKNNDWYELKFDKDGNRVIDVTDTTKSVDDGGSPKNETEAQAAAKKNRKSKIFYHGNL